MKNNFFSIIKYYWKQILSTVVLICLFIGTIVVASKPSETENKAKINGNNKQQVVITPSSDSQKSTQNTVQPESSIPVPSEKTDTSSNPNTTNFEDDAADDTKKTEISDQPIDVETNNDDSVCKAISEYIENRSNDYTGISDTFLDITETIPLWDKTPLNAYSSEDSRYSDLERWTTDANNKNGKDTYPVVTAIIQNNGDSYIVHGLYVGETGFIDDGQFPEEAWYK